MALAEMDWSIDSDAMRIIEGRRYMYKRVKRGVAIDGNISAYEYILEGLVRLQIGYDKQRIDAGILLVNAKRSDKSPLGAVAQRSISNRLGIPYPYLRRCPPDVQALNLNHWITREKNDKLLFRFDGQDVRALFTTKYIPVDNFEVMESPVDDPESTFASFNRQFGLNAPEKEAVEWAWPKEMGKTMFNVVNTYTRAAQWDELPAESSFRLSRVGRNILGMLN